MRNTLATQKKSVAVLDVPEQEAHSAVETGRKCCHYWIIDTPNGGNSRGRCKFCSEEKEFANSLLELQPDPRKDDKKRRDAAVPTSSQPA